MKALFFCALVSLLGSISHAQSVYYDPTIAKMCTDQTFDSDKRSCLSEIKDQHYDSSVVDICTSQTFDSDKRSCLRSIANKVFQSPIETKLCRDQLFASDKIRCLSSASTLPYIQPSNETAGGSNSGSLSIPSLNYQVTRALTAMRSQNYGLADSILQNLKDRLDQVQFNSQLKPNR